MLRRATKGTEDVNLKYDPMGNRVHKVSSAQGTRKYIIDVSGALPTILLELDPCDGMAIKKTYIYANAEILAQHDGDVNAARYFYLHDRLGSVREVIDTNGSVVRHYTYGPFGKTIEESSAGPQAPSNAFQFTGQYYDNEIGQYYLRARQYDPQLMRMISMDIVPGKFAKPLSLHKYLYCRNEPVNHIDPNGCTLLDAILTGGILYIHAIELATYAASSEDWRFFDLAGVTIKFMPIGMAIAGYSPRGIDVWIGVNLVGIEMEAAIHATGMNWMEALAMNPISFFAYWTTMAFAEVYLEIPYGDMDDFIEWHNRW